MPNDVMTARDSVFTVPRVALIPAAPNGTSVICIVTAGVDNGCRLFISYFDFPTILFAFERDAYCSPDVGVLI